MKKQKYSARTYKVTAIMCVLCAVIWTAKLVLLLALRPDSRDVIDWVIEIVCAVVWWVAAVVNTVQWKRGN